MLGTLLAAFVFRAAGKKFRDAEGNNAVEQLIKDEMKPIVAAHVDGLLALGTSRASLHAPSRVASPNLRRCRLDAPDA